jgi:hypothetical protein
MPGQHLSVREAIAIAKQWIRETLEDGTKAGPTPSVATSANQE